MGDLDELFKTPLPADWRARLPQSTARDDSLQRAEKFQGRRLERVVQELGTLNWREKIQLALTYTFPSRVYLQHRYPATKWPLYYLYRWGDILSDVVIVLGRKIKQLVTAQP